MTGAPSDSSPMVVSVASVLSELPEGAIFTAKLVDGSSFRVVAAGRYFQPVAGEVWRILGEWRDDPEYGRQLHGDARQFYRVRPSGALIIPWLCQFGGIGPERAKRIAATLGDDLDAAFGAEGMPIEALAMAIDPDRPSLSASIAAGIRLKWTSVRTEYETVRWLEEQGIEDAGLARKAGQLLGDGAVDILRRNPYCLASVLPWRRVDVMGLRLFRRQPRFPDPRRAPPRIVGACDAVVQEHVANGHTAFPRAGFAPSVAKKLRLSPTAEVCGLIEDLGVRNQAVIEQGDLLRAPGCAVMEDEIERRFLAMLRGEEPSSVAVPPPEALEALVRSLEDAGRPLHPEQREAVQRTLERPLAVLTGGAGTGKTSTAKAIVDAWEALGGRIEMAALSGMAALRLSQGTGRTGDEHRPALTIFRLLKGLERRAKGEELWTKPKVGPDGKLPKPKPKDFLPLLNDRTLLLLDEASMIGLGDLHQVVEKLPVGCRLLLIGDPFQLPPVGFGVVFHRLAEQASITARLTTIHRQTSASGIPTVSRSVRDRVFPAFHPYAGPGGGVSLVECGEGDLTATVVRVIDDLGGFRGEGNDLRIIAALNERGDGAVFALNAVFHQRNHRAQLDPERVDDIKAVKGWLGQWFALGDPVVHKTNDYDRGLFNGSAGRVVGIDPSKNSLRASFDGQVHQFSRKQLINLALGYAVTCHRAQGSQARRVVIPIADSPLVDPTWIYTSITRAEEQAVLVGSTEALQRALDRAPSFMRRTIGNSFDLDGSGLRAHRAA